MATSTFEIYTYFNTDELIAVLNGVAMILGGNDYAGLVKTVLLVGFLAAIMSSLMSQRTFTGTHWFIGAMIVYFGLLVPKVDVMVIDRTNIQPTQVVSNVPLGLGFFAHATSKVGDYLTRQFEQNFSSLNDSLKFRNGGGGLNFASQILKESRAAVISSPTLRRSLYEYVRSCVIYEIQAGNISADTLSSSKDIWTTIKISGPGARLSEVIATNGQSTMMPCSDAWVAIDATLKLENSSALQKLSSTLFPSQRKVLGDAAVNAMLSTSLVNATQLMINSSDSALQTIQQNMMINLMDSSGTYIAQQLNDPAAVQMAAAAAQAEAVSNASYLTTAKIAESALPKIRNVIQMICYAVFPIVLLIMLMAGQAFGSVLKSYVLTLLWLELWPPLYAVLNLVVTLDAARKADAISAATTGGITIATAYDLGQSAISSQAITGYMVVLVPTIAYAIVQGASSLGSLAASALAPSQSAAGTAAQSAATGNMSLGNTQFGNHSHDNFSANSSATEFRIDGGASAFKMADGRGNTISGSSGGITTIQSNMNQMAFGITGSASAANSYSSSADRSHAESIAWSAAAGQSLASTFNSVTGSSKNGTHGKNVTFSNGKTSETVSGSEFAQSRSVVERDASSVGMSTDDAVAFHGAMRAGLKAGKSQPIAAAEALKGLVASKGESGAAFLSNVANKLGIRGSEDLSEKVSSALTTRFAHETGSSEEKAYKTLNALSDRASSGWAVNEQTGLTTSEVKSLNASLQAGHTASQMTTQTESESRTMSQQAKQEWSNAIVFSNDTLRNSDADARLKAIGRDHGNALLERGGINELQRLSNGTAEEKALAMKYAQELATKDMIGIAAKSGVKSQDEVAGSHLVTQQSRDGHFQNGGNVVATDYQAHQHIAGKYSPGVTRDGIDRTEAAAQELVAIEARKNELTRHEGEAVVNKAAEDIKGKVAEANDSSLYGNVAKGVAHSPALATVAMATVVGKGGGNLVTSIAEDAASAGAAAFEVGGVPAAVAAVTGVAAYEATSAVVERTGLSDKISDVAMDLTQKDK